MTKSEAKDVLLLSYPYKEGDKVTVAQKEALSLLGLEGHAYDPNWINKVCREKLGAPRFFIGRKGGDSHWEAFSTDVCADPDGKVDLQAVASKTEYAQVDGEYDSLGAAERAALKR